MRVHVHVRMCVAGSQAEIRIDIARRIRATKDGANRRHIHDEDEVIPRFAEARRVLGRISRTAPATYQEPDDGKERERERERGGGGRGRRKRGTARRAGLREDHGA